MGRRSLVIGLGTLLGLGQACGSDVTSATTGGGSGDGGATGTSSAGEAGTAETTTSADDGSGTDTSGSQDECLESDLPAPFCHVLLPVSIPHRWAGHLDIVVDGVRPLVIHDETTATIRLASPLEPDLTLAEGPASDVLPRNWWASLTADFNGDGVSDFAAFDPSASASVPSDDLSVAVVDGESFEVLALIPEGEGGTRDVAALDVDSDGTVELVTVEYLDDTMELRAWRPAEGSPELVVSVQGGVGCEADDAFTADFDGDGRNDLAVVWNDGCAPHFLADFDGTPQIAAAIAPHSAGEEFTVTHTAQPSWTSQAGAAHLTGSPSAQLVVMDSVEDIRVLEWSGGMFTTLQVLTPPSEYVYASGDIVAGTFTGSGTGGIIFESIVDQDDVPHVGALFLNSPASSFLIDVPFTKPPWTADFNDDGVTDFWSEDGLFVSSIAP